MRRAVLLLVVVAAIVTIGIALDSHTVHDTEATYSGLAEQETAAEGIQHSQRESERAVQAKQPVQARSQEAGQRMATVSGRGVGETKDSSPEDGFNGGSEEPEVPSDEERGRVYREMMKLAEDAQQAHQQGKIGEAEWAASSFVYSLASIFVVPRKATQGLIKELTPAYAEKLAAEGEIQELERLLASREDANLREELGYQRYREASLYLAILDMALEYCQWSVVRDNYLANVDAKIARAKKTIDEYHE